MRTESRLLNPPLFLRALLVGAALASLGSNATAAVFDGKEGRPAVVREKPVANPALDHSGGKRVGKASFYAKMFHGRKMANGKRMDPRDDNAASKTLPLGTTAKVTNLETGRSAVVTIEDRGPYVKGRIVDLSPATAQSIGITRQNGLANVEVTPIAVPQPDGSVKPGAAAGEAVTEAVGTPAPR